MGKNIVSPQHSEEKEDISWEGPVGTVEQQSQKHPEVILEEEGGATPRGLPDIRPRVFGGDGVTTLGASGGVGRGGGWEWLECSDVQDKRCPLSFCCPLVLWTTHSSTVRTLTGEDQYRDPYIQLKPKG